MARPRAPRCPRRASSHKDLRSACTQIGEGQKLLTNTTYVFSFWLRNPASSRGPVAVNVSATVACEPQREAGGTYVTGPDDSPSHEIVLTTVRLTPNDL